MPRITANEFKKQSHKIKNAMYSIPKEFFEPNKVDFFDKSFEKLNFTSVTIQKKEFEKCNFNHCNFDNAVLQDCKFIDCEFINCTLNTINLSNTKFVETSFDKSKLMGINWLKCHWPKIKLSSPINFYSCDISHSNFFGLCLSEINIQECKVHDVDFREADLSNGNLTNSDFYQSLFIHTKLTSVDFSDAINYNIDIKLNDVKGTIFSFPDVINLLQHFEIKIKGLDKYNTSR